MIILALDTASRRCSAAVSDPQGVRAELSDTSGETHSRHLMALIDQVLKMAALSIAGIDGIAVCRGPGSFTGVRIGIATAKGLAAAAGKPLVGVSSLQALAWPLTEFAGPVCPMLDARRAEVYYARYRAVEGRLDALIDARVGPPEQAAAGLDRPGLFVGEGALAYAERLKQAAGRNWHLAAASQHEIRAAHLAELAREGLRQGQNELLTLVPHYLRPSYAQPPGRGTHAAQGALPSGLQQPIDKAARSI